MTRSLTLGFLALCSIALLTACTATGTSSAAIDKPAGTVAASTGTNALPTVSSSQTTAPAPTVTVTAPASTSTVTATRSVTATRTVTAKPTGKGTVRASATELAFVSPSGRIACLMSAYYTDCEYEISDRAWTAPKVAGCDSGNALMLEYEVPTGACSEGVKWDAQIDSHSMQAVGLTSWWQSSDPTVTVEGYQLAALPYGTALVLGAYRCDSATSGVSCENQSTGHGFFMSREKYQVY